MIFLGVILGVIAFFLFSGVYSDYNKFKIQSSVNNVVDKTKLKQCYKGDTLKGTIICIVIGCAFAIGGMACIMNSSGGGYTSYHYLDKDQKQWYQDNYGNGKSKEYTKAIDNYKKSK